MRLILTRTAMATGVNEAGRVHEMETARGEEVGHDHAVGLVDAGRVHVTDGATDPDPVKENDQRAVTGLAEHEGMVTEVVLEARVGVTEVDTEAKAVRAKGVPRVDRADRRCAGTSSRELF